MVPNKNIPTKSTQSVDLGSVELLNYFIIFYLFSAVDHPKEALDYHHSLQVLTQRNKRLIMVTLTDEYTDYIKKKTKKTLKTMSMIQKKQKHIHHIPGYCHGLSFIKPPKSPSPPGGWVPGPRESLRRCVQRWWTP